LNHRDAQTPPIPPTPLEDLVYPQGRGRTLHVQLLRERVRKAHIEQDVHRHSPFGTMNTSSAGHKILPVSHLATRCRRHLHRPPTRVAKEVHEPPSPVKPHSWLHPINGQHIKSQAP